ncbi:Degenerin mec-10 [Toxocara canis]|uniref:Degenerin mec-10 n=1 Tax=Toxocara canis TaxID=6265 RepID=A0A0B2UMV4_TOXCA|nr:Degenerin mec-10 [Toxocara canis]
MASLYLASDTDFLYAADIYSKYFYGDVNDNDKPIQCDLLTEDQCHNIDPTRLPYKERIRWHLKEFCYKTSSHGIPMLGQAPNALYRCAWIILLLGCGCMFVFQAINVVDKYQRNDKITDIQLKFDTAPFPAITICNLNPYKDSLVKDVTVIRKILKVFNDVMLKAGNANVADYRRVRRAKSHAKFEPANSDCSCGEEDGVLQCEAKVTSMPKDDSYCLCAFDRESDDAWPCYPKEVWKAELCAYCDDQNYCTKNPKDGVQSTGGPCLCQTIDPFCIGLDSDSSILDLWLYYREVIEDEERIIEALGFENMSDEVAIVTKAKENLIFAMSELSEQQRIALSIQKRQLIQKCSFNGAECNIEKDFLVVPDPTFGNCFTFNHNRTENKSSIRAGPMYGLRLLVYVNASDYLPTTEAVGVRITIHDKEEYPFPDTFGYSAPTGYISSFGMKMKKMTRLPAPFGDCVPDGLTERYIYDDYRYSTEGCYRTCFQQMVIRECGCGDPRFPVPSNARHCLVFDPEARKCLERRTNELSDIHGSFRCRCQQPCSQSVYTVSYSAGIWPSQSLNISIGNCNDEPDICNEQYQENGAMVEVFYEALNFEMLTESEAYGVVKMLSDFGGQLGLWSGVSFITCCEFVFLLIETLYMMFDHHYRKYKRNRSQKEDEMGRF